jgi:hypothetical protein
MDTNPKLYKCDGGRRCHVRPQYCPARPPHTDDACNHTVNFECPYLRDRGCTRYVVNCVPCDKRGRRLL